MSRLSVTVSVLALIGALASNPAEAVQRAFVASSGSDANTAMNCTFANPCRGFAAAMTVVDSGGEVVALDAAGYGAVTITKSVTITANPGFYAGISASTGNAVTIATGGINVRLRGLNINGIGATNGVSMTNGARLSIENCVISNFSLRGVDVETAATVRIVDSLMSENFTGASFSGGATATISGSKFLGNTDTGVWANGDTAATTTVAISDSVFTNPNIAIFALSTDAGAITRVSVTRSTLSNNANGAAVNGTAGTTVLTISDSMVTGNTASGFFQSGTGTTLESLGNNTVRQNGTDTGTVTTVSLR